MRVKFIVILIGGLLLLMNAYGMCYTNNSFRNQSTAFTLDDDLDEWIADYSLNMTNPSGLFKFDGYRLYTNLSNLVNKNEGQFSNSSLDNFLVGGSGDFYRGYRFGSIVNRERYENDYEYSSDHSEFTDNDNNGTFDSRERYISETGTDTTDVSTEFIFALAGQKAKLDYGISFELYNNKCVSDRVTNYDTSSMDLVTGQLNRIASDDLNWGYDCKTNITAITLGGLYHKSQRLNIGGRIGISMEGYEANDNRLELCSTDRSPADADLLDQTYTKDDQTTLEKYKGSIFMGGLTFEYQTTPDIFSIFEITAYTGKLDNDGGEYTRYIDETAYLTLGDDTTFTTVDADVMGNNNYDSERKGLEVYHRNTVSLANDVTFAFGLSFRGTSYETTNLISADSTSNEVYDDGDNQPDDPDDYTRTVTSDYSTSKKETSATTTLSVPVGLEFYPVRKLAFRLGALFRCVERETETNTIILSSSAQHERIVYGDGTVSEALLQDPYDPGTNTHSLTKNIYTDTHYYYGAGWDVTENLQLDFMGFADMTDLVNWKLSAIFKFF